MAPTGQSRRAVGTPALLSSTPAPATAEQPPQLDTLPPPPVADPFSQCLLLPHPIAPSTYSALATPTPSLTLAVHERAPVGQSLSLFGVHRGHPKQEKLQAVIRMADELELSGSIGARRPTEWTGEPDPFELQLDDELLRRAHTRIQRSTEPESILYALGWYRIHRAVFPHRVGFVELTGGPGDVAASIYNENTILSVGELMRLYGSIKPGQLGATLKGRSIAAVQGTLRAFREREAGHDLQLPIVHSRATRQRKDMLREDGPVIEDRRRREGLRVQHLAAAAQGGIDRTSLQGQQRWSVLHFCLNAVARGSAAGKPKRSTPWDPRVGLTCADVQLLDGVSTGTGRPGFICMVFPGKDCRREHRKRPIPVSARAVQDWSGDGADPRDPYLALLPAYHAVRQEVPEHARWHTPFFRRRGVACQACEHCDGSLDHLCALATCDVAIMVGDAREAAGFPRDEHELAQELRIGGATDIYEVYGLEGKEILERRGRWGKDIAYIYARISATRLFEASSDMTNAGGHALESLVPAWTQGNLRL